MPKKIADTPEKRLVRLFKPPHHRESAVRLWVKRFNSMSIDGLIYRPQPGRPRKLVGETVASTILPVVDDPSLANRTH